MVQCYGAINIKIEQCLGNNPQVLFSAVKLIHSMTSVRACGRKDHTKRIEGN